LSVILKALMVVLVAHVPPEDVNRLLGIEAKWFRYNWDVLNISRDNRPLIEKFGYTFDTRWYIRISENGYKLDDDDAIYISQRTPPGIPVSANLYDWLFMYPLFIRLLSIFIGPIPAGLLIANAASVISVALFYLLATNYVGNDSAFRGAVLLIFYPYNIMTMASFSEPLYMLFALISWFFFMKWRIIPAGFMMMLASFTRYPGAMLFPIFSAILINRLRGGKASDILAKLILLNIFFIPLLFWMYVEIPMQTGYTQTQFASLTWGFHPFPGIGLVGASFFGMFFLYFALVGAYQLKNINKDLMFYSFGFIIVHLTLGFGGGIGRYLGVVWPLFIYYGHKLDMPDTAFFSALFLFIGSIMVEFHVNSIFWI